MLGYTEDMYILPFDHRASFKRDIAGKEDKLSANEVKILADSKKLIWEGFLRVWKKTKVEERSKLGIFIDDELGKHIINQAKRGGALFVLAVEKSGQEEFDFEHGRSFGKFILAVRPNLVKALVRYNPEGEKAMNGRQLKRLKILNNWCKKNGFKLVVELLVPAICRGEKKEIGRAFFEEKVRPGLTVRAVRAFHLAGIEPDIWKIEAMEKRESWSGVIREIRRQKAREKVGIIMLGRGASEAQVGNWIKNCPKDKVNGFAVGRTVWQRVINDWRAGKINRERAVNKIGNNFGRLIEAWKAR